jgi:hypothetical protein
MRNHLNSKADERRLTMKRNYLRIMTSVGFGMLLCFPSRSLAQIAPSLGSAERLAVLGATTVTNTGPSVLNGSLGISPGNLSSITGFPPGVVYGATYAAGEAAPAQSSVTTAYNALLAQACTTNYGPGDQDLNGLTLTPGVYCFASTASIGSGGTLTLDALGNPNAVFVFLVGSAVTANSGSRIVLANGASACNVFWQVTSSATLGTTVSFAGNILALQSITMNTGASLTGRALARNAAVTLDTNTIGAAVCGAPVTPVPVPITTPPTVPITAPPGTPIPVPTLPEWALMTLMALLALAGFKAMRRRTA